MQYIHHIINEMCSQVEFKQFFNGYYDDILSYQHMQINCTYQNYVKFVNQIYFLY